MRSQNHLYSEETTLPLLINKQTPPPTPASASAHNIITPHQRFIFTLSLFFIFLLLWLFYLFYLRPRRLHSRSMPHRFNTPHLAHITTCELGLKKEHREMLPIIIFKESFSVKDTQCPVCLADYQAEERLQQIPACGHTFHMSCIDLWLATHPTCPLCRLSLIPSPKPSDRSSDSQETTHILSSGENRVETTSQGHPESGDGDISHNMRN